MAITYKVSRFLPRSENGILAGYLVSVEAKEDSTGLAIVQDYYFDKADFATDPPTDVEIQAGIRDRMNSAIPGRRGVTYKQDADTRVAQVLPSYAEDATRIGLTITFA